MISLILVPISGFVVTINMVTWANGEWYETSLYSGIRGQASGPAHGAA